MKYLLLLLLTILFSGCNSKYKEISSDKKYLKVIEKTFELQVPVKIYEITKATTPLSSIDSYLLMVNGSLGGPEGIGKHELNTKLKIKIKRVMYCTNCLSKYVEFRIEVFSKKIKNEIPISLSTHTSTILSSDEQYILMNPKYFKEIK